MQARKKVSKVEKFQLELFVSGLTSKSIRTIELLRSICETHLSDNYDLKIIDIYKDPKLAKENQVFAVPTLIKKGPGRKRVFIGDLTQPEGLYIALGIRRKDEV